MDCALLASERNRQEDNLAAVDLDLVADRPPVLALGFLLHSLDLPTERGVGDVVDLLAERPLRAHVFVVEAGVILLGRLLREHRWIAARTTAEARPRRRRARDRVGLSEALRARRLGNTALL